MGNTWSVLAAVIQKAGQAGGESWWNHNSGSLFIALAAIIAAGLAAYVSIRNHHQQLSHDRDMRNREATRDVIDLAVEGIGEAIEKTATFVATIASLELVRNRLDSAQDEDQKAAVERALEEGTAQAKKAKRSAYDSARKIDIQSVRLAIRLGIEHSIHKKHEETRKGLDELQDAISAGLKKNRTDDEKALTEEKLAQFSRCRSAFDHACHVWFNDEILHQRTPGWRTAAGSGR